MSIDGFDNYAISKGEIRCYADALPLIVDKKLDFPLPTFPTTAIKHP